MSREEQARCGTSSNRKIFYLNAGASFRFSQFCSEKGWICWSCGWGSQTPASRRKECHLLLWPGGYLSFLISMHFINYGNHLFNESLTVCKWKDVPDGHKSEKMLDIVSLSFNEESWISCAWRSSENREFLNISNWAQFFV